MGDISMPLPEDNLLFGYANKLTDEQREYVDAIYDYQFVACNAPAGSGKTMLAVMMAKVMQRDLIYIFSPVEESRLGYLPGTLEDKTEPYLSPLYDALLEMGEHPYKVIKREDNLDNAKNGNVWVQTMSHVYVRGMNIKSDSTSQKMVIIDEAQNFTKSELKKVLSRIHDNVKVVMIGHDQQCDLDNPHKSGFIPYIDHFQGESYFKLCTLSVNFRGKLSSHADKLT